MITIEGQHDSYILDLNNSMESHRELYINSYFDGTSVSWIVDYVSTPIVIVHPFSENGISIDVNLEKLKEDGYIYLRNLMNDRFVIILKPNLEASRDKNYIFKLGKNTINDKTISINVISKENGKTEPWSIVRDGQPISYNISTTKTKITIELTMILSVEFTSSFELIQNNSNKTIKFGLKHADSNSVELVEYKEAD